MKISPRHIRQTGDDRPVDTLLEYVWRMSGWHQVWVCLLAAVAAALTMAPLELQRRIIDEALKDADTGLLIRLGILFLSVLLLSGVLKFLLRMYQGWLAESAIRYSRAHLLRINAEKQKDGEDGGEGRAVAIIGAEIDRLGGFVGEGLSQPVVNAGMLIAILGYMLWVQPLIALIGMALLVPQAIVAPLMQTRINRLIEDRVERMRAMSDAIGSDEPLNDTIGRADELFWNRIKTFFVKYLMKALLNLANGLAPLGVLVIGGIFVIRGEASIGTVVAFVTGFERLGNPLRELLTFYRVAAQASVQHRMIAKWM